MSRIRRWYSPVTVAIVAGIVFAGCTLLVHLYLASFEHDHGLAAQTGMQLWILGGAFLFGALPAYTSALYRVVSPALIAVVVFGLTLAASFPIMVASAGSAGAGIAPTIFEIGLWYWPLSLWIPLLVGSLEYGVRRVTEMGLDLQVENRT